MGVLCAHTFSFFSEVKHSILILSLFVITLFSTCISKNRIEEQGGVKIQFKYASNIDITDFGGYINVKIRNPWDTTKLLHTYILVPADSVLPTLLPSGTVVRTPIKNALVYTSVHVGLLSNLGALNQVGGVCDAKYLLQPKVSQLIADGKIIDAGDAMSPDIEKIVQLAPDAVLLSPFENSGGYGVIENIGIPIIECADYMENSSLACAEWMRFYGLLFGCEFTADSLFFVVEKNYCSLRDSAMTLSNHPLLLAELKTGSAWYVPSGGSTTGRFYVDAGANYIFADIKTAGAVPYSFESVFERGHNADYWVFKYNRPIDMTYKQLQLENELYTKFSAFKNRHIYGCNTAHVPYYDEAPFRPDWLLRDLVKILHPELLPNYELRYYSALE